MYVNRNEVEMKIKRKLKQIQNSNTFLGSPGAQTYIYRPDAEWPMEKKKKQKIFSFNDISESLTYSFI